ncbi:loganic acid O-methyltransferase-like [Argentina anserina]|uniref:loganic acid O-methyltransferase-like n=1 Tax=Argentina anserina TaxID=57926 RepID=UPI0021766BAD|nr:loganic acid O-methyltransferase-like [Potentilla anserina]
MAEGMSLTSSEGFPMNGGDGEGSYFINSSHQRYGADRSKGMMVAKIFENLSIENMSSSTTLRIADLGCSVGPNTFTAVETIIEAVSQKYHTTKWHHSGDLPEYQVYFTDVVSNDFNHLFTNLPQPKQYFAAAVPGSFHGRLFPKFSLDIVYSAYALHWLSKTPQELLDPNSPAYNKGRILYANSPNEVAQAYETQYAKDIQCFLHARAQEISPQGLMVLLVPGRPDGTSPQQPSIAPIFEPVESCLADLVNEGLLSEDKFDTFNLPMYCPCMEELKSLIHKNGCFDILTLEMQPPSPSPSPFHSAQEMRAGLDSILIEHFGHQIVEQLFDRYSKKVAGRSRLAPSVGLFVILKRRYVESCNQNVLDST